MLIEFIIEFFPFDSGICVYQKPDDDMTNQCTKYSSIHNFYMCFIAYKNCDDVL